MHYRCFLEISLPTIGLFCDTGILSVTVFVLSFLMFLVVVEC